MLLSRLGVSASIVCLCQASLGLPNLHPDDGNILKGLSLQDVKPNDEYLVQINYPGARTSPRLKTNTHFNQVNSVLEFNFTIHHKESDQLILNELMIYPAKPKSQAVIESLSAPHLIKNDNKKWEHASIVRLGYLVTELSSPRDGNRQRNANQIFIQVDIFEVVGKIFDKIQTIDLQLVSNPYGKLMIEVAETTMSKTPISVIHGHGKCHSFLCNTKSALSRFLTKTKGALKSCHKPGSTQPAHSHKNSTPQPQSVENHPHHHEHLVPDHSDRSQKHYPKHRPSFFRRAILPYLAPVIMGVVIGISSGIIGIIFGHAAIYIWTVVRHWNSSRYARIEQSEIDDLDQDTFDGFQASSHLPSSRKNSIEIINEKNDR